MTGRLLPWLLLVLALAAEGAWLGRLPLSLLHLLYLPAVLAGGRHRIKANLALLALAEWSLGRIPLGAALSTAATLYLVYVLVREDLNAETPLLGLVLLPGLELVRHFWISLFLALYGIPAVPALPWWHLPVEALVSVPLLTWSLRWRQPGPGRLA